MGHNFIVSNPQILIMSIIRNYILLEILLESIRLLDSDSCKASNLWVLWDPRFWFILRSRKEPGRDRDSHCQRYMLFHLTQHQNANCLMISSVLWLYTVSQSFWHVPPDYILHFVGADGLKPLNNHFPSGFGSWLVAGKREGSHPLSVSALISVVRHQDGCALIQGWKRQKVQCGLVQGFYADVPGCMLHVFADMVSF